MAKRKRRKLYGAALAAHQKKKGGGKRRKARRPSKRRASSRRRPVRASRKHAYIPQTKRNKDGSRPRIKRSRSHVHDYMRNPRKRRHARRNPGLFGMNQMGSTAMQGLMGAGVILGTILAVGYANRQLERWQTTQVGWGNIAGKLAIAVAGGVAATWLVRKGKLSREMGYAVTGAAFAPLLLGGVARFMPNLAAQVSLADEDGMAAQLEAPMGPESEAAVHAELEAQLEDEAESEASMF